MSRGFKSTKNIIMEIKENRNIFRSEGYNLWRLKKEWIAVTGERIGENTVPVQLRDGVLVIDVNDASIYHFMITAQDIIIAKSNKYLGRIIIESLDIRKKNRSIRRGITDDLIENERIRKEKYGRKVLENRKEEKSEEDEINRLEISSQEIEAIEESISKIESRYSEFSGRLKEIALNKIKKDKYMLKKGYRKCGKCGSIYYPVSDDQICPECHGKEETLKMEMMSEIIMKNPFIGEKKAAVLAGTDEYTYYKVRDLLAQRTYNDILYLCEKTDIDIVMNEDYSTEIRNEFKVELEILIKEYIDYKIGTEEMSIFLNERKKLIRKIKNDMKFRKNR